MGQSFTLSDAARLCGVSRTTLQRAIRAGRLRLNAVHRLEKGELIHAGYFPSGPTTDGVAESREQTDEMAERLDQLAAQIADLLTQHQTLGAKLERMQEDLQALKSPKLSHGQARQLILAFMKRNPGPHNVREVQQGLGWTHTPRHHLRHLTNDGVLHRVGPGVYELPLSKNDCSQQ
jgi:DNA-binding transcriptional MerR regulator